MRRATLLLAVVTLTALSSDAHATRNRRPYHQGTKLGHGFDNNYSAGGCVDWACGGTCYDTHSGSDFPIGFGSEVVAGAPGTVVQVSQGCNDWGYRGNPCGGYCGNYVRIAHPDGSHTMFCHLKNGSIAVGNGQQVSCGQKLGNSASSGSSTGPHLHFGWKPNGGSSADSFSGSCSGTKGAWVDQGGYPGLPSTDCEVNCDCSPGQQQTDGCGQCGHRVRTCEGNCHWGGWSGCLGEGPCSPGAVETEGCCDCGTTSRTCGGDCQWTGWSGCAGPDPAGSPPCDTGLLGVCADGTIRCLEGCLGCAQHVYPTDEVCDGLDNDCDGPVDDEALTLGEPPPPLAATLEDLSAPTALPPLAEGLVWARFRNVGTAAWPAGTAWLAAVGEGGGPSPLSVPEAWAAWDASAAVAEEVGPGEATTVTFPIRMPAAGEATASRFALTVQGTELACPTPFFELAPVWLAPSVSTGTTRGDGPYAPEDAVAHEDAHGDADADVDGEGGPTKEPGEEPRWIGGPSAADADGGGAVGGGFNSGGGGASPATDAEGATAGGCGASRGPLPSMVWLLMALAVARWRWARRSLRGGRAGSP